MYNTEYQLIYKLSESSNNKIVIPLWYGKESKSYAADIIKNQLSAYHMSFSKPGDKSTTLKFKGLFARSPVLTSGLFKAILSLFCFKYGYRVGSGGFNRLKANR